MTLFSMVKERKKDRMESKNIKSFQSKINYKYKDETLLVRALTHSSYENEHKMKKFENN